MLGVSPNTLRSWERRFGYPTPRRTAGGHRQFDLAEIEALREAFERDAERLVGRRARARARAGPRHRRARCAARFARFDEDEADRVLEESLAVRSVERTVEEVLLPGVERSTTAGEPPSPEHGFAWRWATGWLAARRRVAPPATRERGRAHLRRQRAARRRRAARAGARAAAAPRGLRTLVPRARLEPGRLAARCTPLDAARRRPHRPPRVARRARPARLRRAATRRGVGVFDFRGALPETRREHRRRASARAPPRRARRAASRASTGAEAAASGKPARRRRSRLRRPLPRRSSAAMTLVPGDPLAHRALDSLLRAEASVRRRLSADLEREGLSAPASPCSSSSPPPAASSSCARCARGCGRRRPTRPRSSRRSRRAASSPRAAPARTTAAPRRSRSRRAARSSSTASSPSTPSGSARVRRARRGEKRSLGRDLPQARRAERCPLAVGLPVPDSSPVSPWPTPPRSRRAAPTPASPAAPCGRRRRPRGRGHDSADHDDARTTRRRERSRPRGRRRAAEVEVIAARADVRGTIAFLAGRAKVRSSRERSGPCAHRRRRRAAGASRLAAPDAA